MSRLPNVVRPLLPLITIPAHLLAPLVTATNGRPPPRGHRLLPRHSATAQQHLGMRRCRADDRDHVGSEGNGQVDRE